MLNVRARLGLVRKRVVSPFYLVGFCGICFRSYDFVAFVVKQTAVHSTTGLMAMKEK